MATRGVDSSRTGQLIPDRVLTLSQLIYGTNPGVKPEGRRGPEKSEEG